MEEHWNDEQVEEFLRLGPHEREESIAAGKTHGNAWAHLNSCDPCKSRLQTQERAMDRLAQLRPQVPGAPGQYCPPDSVWVEIASGAAPEGVESHLSHAATCDHCGLLLHQSFADCAGELTPEEESMLVSLDSSSAQWQKKLASKLNDASQSTNGRIAKSNRKPYWIAVILAPRLLVYATGTLGLIIFGTWFALHEQMQTTAEELIANAYAEKRNVEIRIEGAPHVPFQQERGTDTQGRMSRPALLKAEAEIASHLKSNPENITWLQASGRSNLLEGDADGTEQAFLVLDKAHDLDPANHSITVDLASAYLQRGETANRPEDLGTAAELLGKVLALTPEDEIAQFNYAITLGKLNLNQQALAAWQRFLQSHPSSPWAGEARQRQDQVQKMIRERSGRSNAPLKSVQAVAAAFQERYEADIVDIDSRVEEYQDVAVQDWLPIFLNLRNPNSAEGENLKSALYGLANILKSRHQDEWLQDMLTASHLLATTPGAVSSLARSERSLRQSDDHSGQAAAFEASSLFKRIGVPAGVLRSQLSLALIFQLQHESRKCETLAVTLSKDLSVQVYPWLKAQSLLEEAACASTSDERAPTLVRGARRIAQEHRYPILALRAANFESAAYQALGDRKLAWSITEESLGQFWRGSFPAVRGYSLLVNLHELAKERQEWFLETAVLREALAMIASYPDVVMKAFEQARLGQAELRAGDIPRAEDSFHTAEELFRTAPKGTRRDALNEESEVGLAKAELEQGRSCDAMHRLQEVRPSISRIADDDLQLDFLQTSGISQLRCGFTKQAAADLSAAIGLAEEGLPQINTEIDRWRWRQMNETSYRALVELELQSDSAKALQDWERFKGATLTKYRVRYTKVDGTHPPSAEKTKDDVELAGIDAQSVFVSFAIFQDTAAVWVWDRSRLKQLWIPLPALETSLQIRRFEEHCSNPNSNVALIQREGVELYGKLFSAIDPWIAGHRQLIIEPDGILRSVPFEVLVDTHGKYLGDSFDLTISPGIEYLNRSRNWTGITAESKASVLGNPAAPGWVPLPEAEQEARSVAALFSNAHLMLRETDDGKGISLEINRAQVFHFSGHASATVDASGLVIGGSDLLDAFHFTESKDAQTELVVLSACNSSSGSGGYFDDEDSLVRRFMGARVPAIVASRWMVDSAATSALMKSFYSTLLAGKPVAESLSAAKRDIRSRQQFAHPFYWAGFSVFGRS